MVVDDAVVVRTLMSRWIGEQPGLTVVAALRSGREAVDQFEQYDPDVVVLDVDMPHLDGISTLPLLLEKKRDLAVIMASALTRDSIDGVADDSTTGKPARCARFTAMSRAE